MRSIDDFGTAILAIDPDPLSKKILQKILTGAGGRVHCVCNTEQALDALDEAQYDLMVINMLKLEPSTFEFVKLVRFSQLGIMHLPVILLSPPLTDCARNRCDEAAIDACLVKPVDPGRLIEAMEKLTQPREARRRLN